MLATPHMLVEGAIITCFAIQADQAFIVRPRRGAAGACGGSSTPWPRRTRPAYPRLRHPQLGLRPRHRRPLRGRRQTSAARRRRCSTRWRATGAAPAQATVPGGGAVLLPHRDQQRRVDRLRAVDRDQRRLWVDAMGTPKSTGFGIFSFSGHVTTPGQYEAPLGITLRELLDLAGGVRAGHRLKFWTPGGSSTPILTDEHLDAPLDFEGDDRGRVAARHPGAADLRRDHLRGQGRSEVDRVLRQHESCGKCTPCRGRGRSGWSGCSTGWSTARAARKTWKSCWTSATTSSAGRSVRSATARSARSLSSIKYFRDEYLQAPEGGRLPVRPGRLHPVREFPVTPAAGAGPNAAPAVSRRRGPASRSQRSAREGGN